jgi:RNA-directed DNA polymerase
MARRYFDLYEKVWHPLNLYTAFRAAACGKRAHPAVAGFEYNLEAELIQLEEELRQESYQPGVYHNFSIQRPKRRLISAAPFRDRVVHHALMNVIEPLFERQFIHDSYANRVAKGTHRALDRCTHFMRRSQFVMHCDVRQYFPSIDHTILLEILGRTLGDPKVIALIAKILASGGGVQAGEYEMIYFPGDDLFAASRPRGLPIGNLTSQHWGNVFLNELDQYVKRTLKCRFYLRYVDDMVFFANEKSSLHAWRLVVIEFLEQLRLRLHENRAQPRPVRSGVPFLGFTVFPDHRRLKRQNGIAFRRRLKALVKRWRAGQLESEAFDASLAGWINHVRYGDTYGLRKAILDHVGLAAEF